MNGDMISGVIAIIAFVVAFSIARMFLHNRAKRAALREHARTEQKRLEKLQEPLSRNKNKRRRQQRIGQ